MDTIEYTKFSDPLAQRAAGLAQLGCASAEGRTRLRRLYQDGSAKIRLPAVLADPLEAVLINTAGGLITGRVKSVKHSDIIHGELSITGCNFTADAFAKQKCAESAEKGKDFRGGWLERMGRTAQ